MQLEQLKNSYKTLYHASIYINNGIYIDPYMINDESHDAKYIFITHSHYDHLSIDDVKKLLNDNTIIVATIDSIENLKKSGITNKMIEVIPNEVYKIDELKVTTIPAYNKQKKFHPCSNNWVGYKIETNDMSYYIIGDSDYNDYMDNVNCDVLFVPIGGTYTMDYIEASKLVKTIRPKIAVPIHFNSLKGLEVDKKKFIKLIDKEIIID